MQKMNRPTLQPPSNQVIFFCNIGGKSWERRKYITIILCNNHMCVMISYLDDNITCDIDFYTQNGINDNTQFIFCVAV